MQTTDGVKLPG